MLAEYWLQRGVRPDFVYSGTLLRQRRTAEVVGEVFAAGDAHWPSLQVLPGLDEYPADDIVDRLGPAIAANDAVVAELLKAVETTDDASSRYRSIHRMLEAVMAGWVEGNYDESAFPGLMSWKTFSNGVRSALETIMVAAGSGSTVAVFTSGGPVGVSLQTVLQAPEIKAAETNWRIHNCSVTRFTFSGARISLDSFNDVAHLAPDHLSFR
jgi:broad specificity phosphatase PhoE